MDKLTLQALKRTIAGRKVKALRAKGGLPANVYGKHIKSKAVEVDAKSFVKIFSKAGETGLVNLDIEGEMVPVLIHNVQYHPVTDSVLHADFFQVNLKEKVSAKVPIELIGESPAVKEKIGVLLILLNEIEVEALPADLPDRIAVDVSTLSTIDAVVKVKDVRVGGTVKLLTDGESDLVKVAPLVSREAQEMAKEQETQAQQAVEAASSTVSETSTQAAEKPTGKTEDKESSK